jgi:hypothetical protein
MKRQNKSKEKTNPPEVIELSSDEDTVSCAKKPKLAATPEPNLSFDSTDNHGVEHEGASSASALERISSYDFVTDLDAIPKMKKSTSSASFNSSKKSLSLKKRNKITELSPEKDTPPSAKKLKVAPIVDDPQPGPSNVGEPKQKKSAKKSKVAPIVDDPQPGPSNVGESKQKKSAKRSKVASAANEPEPKQKKSAKKSKVADDVPNDAASDDVPNEPASDDVPNDAASGDVPNDPQPSKKVKKSNNANFGDTKDLQTIKCSLKKIVPDERIRGRIIEDVLEMSRLAVEFSFFVYHAIYKMLDNGLSISNEIKFLDFMEEARRENRDPTYEQFRNEAGVNRQYDCSFRQNFYKDITKQYETVLRNNIWMNAKERVKRFLKKHNPEATKRVLEKYVEYMFDYNFYDKECNATFEPDINFLPIEQISWLTEPGFFEDSARLSTCLPFLKVFYKIQKINELNKWKNFKLVPLYKHGRKHISYTDSSFYVMLCSFNKTEHPYIPMIGTRRMPGTQFKKPQFKQYLTLDPKLEDRFDSFTTDGVVACCKYIRKEKEKNDNIEPTDPVVPPPIPEPGVKYVGIDPGRRMFIGAVALVDTGYENIKIYTNTYRHENGSSTRKNKLRRWTIELETEIETDRLSSGSPNAEQKSTQYEILIRHKLRWYEAKMEVYLQSKIARLNFDEFIRKHQVLSHYINDIIIGDSSFVIVYFGNGTQAANSPIRGYVKVPFRLLRHMLGCHPKIQLEMVDEHRTTMCCSFCFKRLLVPRGKDRYVYCRHCNKMSSRDINAANNILRLGLKANTPVPREYNFQHGTPRPPLQETNKRVYKRMLRAAQS